MDELPSQDSTTSLEDPFVDHDGYVEAMFGTRPPAPNPVVEFVTDLGTFYAEILLIENALTASNFLDLCKSGFYDGTTFHRVVEGFIIQAGCPFSKEENDSTDTGCQDKVGRGRPPAGSTFPLLAGPLTGKMVPRHGGIIPDEFFQRIPNEPGTLAMACETGHPHGGGSQFFINLAHNQFLDWWDRRAPSRHVVFGRLANPGSFELVQRIGTVEVDENERPRVPVRIQKISVVNRRPDGTRIVSTVPDSFPSGKSVNDLQWTQRIEHH